MDAVYLRRHRASLLRLGAVLLILLGGVAAAALTSAVQLRNTIGEERQMAAAVKEGEGKAEEARRTYEAKEQELRQVKVFSDRVLKYLEVAKAMNRTGLGGTFPGATPRPDPSRSMFERLAADNMLTLGSYTPVYSQRKVIGGQTYVGTSVSLQLKGPYVGCGRFIAAMENTVPFLYTEQLVLEPSEAEGAKDQLRFTLQVFLIDSTEKKL